LDILQDETDRGWRDREIAGLFIRMHRNMLAKIADTCVGAAGTVSIGESLRNLQTQLMQ
jgi:hypothetical protein